MQHRKNISLVEIRDCNTGIWIVFGRGVDKGPRSYSRRLKYVLRGGVSWGREWDCRKKKAIASFFRIL
jgi:hypothetical protein